MNDLSTTQLIIVAVIGVQAAAFTGILLMVGVEYLWEKYGKKPLTGAKQ